MHELYYYCLLIIHILQKVQVLRESGTDEGNQLYRKLIRKLWFLRNFFNIVYNTHRG